MNYRKASVLRFLELLNENLILKFQNPALQDGEPLIADTKMLKMQTPFNIQETRINTSLNTFVG